MRIVLDTACFVTAVRSSSGAVGELLRKVFREEIVLLMDLKLSLEYRDVALRAEHLVISSLDKREVIELIEALEAFAEPVEIVQKIRPLSPDPDDDMILDLAVNGLAEAVVTYNKRHLIEAGRKYGMAILSPAELLRKISTGEQGGDPST